MRCGWSGRAAPARWLVARDQRLFELPMALPDADAVRIAPVRLAPDAAPQPAAAALQKAWFAG